MRILLTGAAVLAAIAAVAPAGAADKEAVIVPGVFTAPPAFPARREATVVPDVFGAPPAYPAVQLYDWTGAYVGINAGAGFGRMPWTSTPDGTSGTSSVSGALVGGTAGYNLQTREPLVLGVEADLAWSSIGGTVPPFSCGSNCEVNEPWFATARLRFGYALDTIMPYATVGLAMARLTGNSVGQPFGTERVNNLGWTAGAGLEFVILGPWRAKVEYLYADLNGFSCELACGGGPISINVHQSIVRAGLNYRLWVR
jgi:outer membrane immunogenic protein